MWDFEQNLNYSVNKFILIGWLIYANIYSTKLSSSFRLSFFLLSLTSLSSYIQFNNWILSFSRNSISNWKESVKCDKEQSLTLLAWSIWDL